MREDLVEVIGSHEELIWPGKIGCGHSDHEDSDAIVAETGKSTSSWKAA